jgi:peptidoglycan/xylan/chitin deacetylase (PgdA/CDA1 family)
MRLISPILRRAVYPVLGRAGFFRLQAAPVSVVTYHGVLPRGYRSLDPFLDDPLLDVESFRSQLRLLKRHYHVISPENFLRWLQRLEDLPPRSVLLTCDDGLVNHLTVMLPVLQEEQLKCLFFVTGKSASDSPGILWYVELYRMLMNAEGSRDSVSWRGTAIPAIPASPHERRAVWNQFMKVLSGLDTAAREEFLQDAAGAWGVERCTAPDAGDRAQRERFCLLTSAQLKQLSSTGMTIGAHTMSHPMLSVQPRESAQAEISECRSALQTCLGRPIWALAYPFGDADSVGAREYELAKSAGYDCAFVNVAHALDRNAPFSLPRVHITAAMSLSVFEAHISGFHSLAQRKIRGPA